MTTTASHRHRVNHAVSVIIGATTIPADLWVPEVQDDPELLALFRAGADGDDAALTELVAALSDRF